MGSSQMALIPRKNLLGRSHCLHGEEDAWHSHDLPGGEFWGPSERTRAFKGAGDSQWKVWPLWVTLFSLELLLARFLVMLGCFSREHRTCRARGCGR